MMDYIIMLCIIFNTDLSSTLLIVLTLIPPVYLNVPVNAELFVMYHLFYVQLNTKDIEQNYYIESA